MDPRPFQIMALSALLGLGLLGLEFDLRASTPLVLVATALGTQYLGSEDAAGTITLDDGGTLCLL